LLTFKDVENFLLCPRRYYFRVYRENEKEDIQEMEGFEVAHHDPDVTRELLRMGFSVLQPAETFEVFGETLLSQPDLIVKESDGWRIIVHKKAKNFKRKYILEAAFHGYVFSSKGWHVKDVVFISPFFKISVDWREGVGPLFSVLQAISDLTEPPDPIPSRICRNCPIQDECSGILIEKGDLRAIHGVGDRTIKELKELGIKNLWELSEVSEGLLAKHFGPERGRRLKRMAEALVEKKPVFFGKVPEIPEGIVLDMESYPAGDIDFLYGFLEGERYVPFFVDTPVDVKETFFKVLEYLESREGPIYHYHGFEPGRFKNLLLRFKLDPRKFSKLLKRFTDVYTLLSNTVALPVTSYSLKVVGKWLGYKWRVNLAGSAIISHYEKWLKTGMKKYLEEILMYNEDDVRATKKVLDFLKEQAPKAQSLS